MSNGSDRIDVAVERVAVLEAEVAELRARLAQAGRRDEEAAAAQRASEAWSRVLLERSGTANVVFDLQCRVVLHNALAADYLGRTGEDGSGRHVLDLVDPLRGGTIVRRVERIFATGAAESFDTTFELPGGRFAFHTTYEPILDANGVVEAVLLVALDVTDRQMAVQALRDEEARLHDIIEGTRVATWEWNVQTGETVFDESWAQILGYALAELQPVSVITWQTLTHPDDLKRSNEELQRHFADETPIYEVENRMRHKDGSWVWVLAHGRVVSRTPDGKPLTMFGYHADISERKRADAERERLQSQLFQSQKLESIGRLAGGVAHDFNNMLGVILGHTEMLLEQVSPDSQLHADLQEIWRSAQRSADLTRQLLAFARKQTAEAKVLDLNATVQGMFKMLRRLIGEHIDLVWRPGENLPPIKIDPSQVDQVLANLCVNARDAIVGVGQVVIETRAVTLARDEIIELPAGDYLLLSVSDTGCGFSAEALEHLFEPFFTSKETGKGTGLGLATVYGIVRQNGGIIQVSSEAGRGTTFRIYLPRYSGDADAHAQQPLPARAARRGSETILVVEDESALLRLSTRVLESLGYEVLPASGPSQALELAAWHSGEIHLLLTDVVMPEMNGRQLAERLQQRHPRLKRLFMSGYTADAISHHGVLEDGVDFVQKPFTREGLAAKVREVLKR